MSCVHHRLWGSGGAHESAGTGAVAGASRLTAAEVDELRRAAAVGPLDTAVGRAASRTSASCWRSGRRSRRSWPRLALVFGDLQAVLNELHRVLDRL